MSKEKKLARLKPYDLTRGHILRTYSYKGMQFIGGAGWYSVDEDVAEYLAKVRQRPGDERTPYAFDVKTEADAKSLEKKEQEDKQPESPADRPKPVKPRAEEDKLGKKKEK